MELLLLLLLSNYLGPVSERLLSLALRLLANLHPHLVPLWLWQRDLII